MNFTKTRTVCNPIGVRKAPRDHRFLPATRGLQLSHGGGEYQEVLPRPRPPGDVWHLEFSAPVHVLPKFIVVVDDDINIRDWKDVIWAITTRVDPTRDTLLADSTPIDYLDFASPVSGRAARWGWTPPTSGRAKPAANGANRSR